VNVLLALVAALLGFGQQPTSAVVPQLVSLNTVVGAIAHAQNVTVSAYTLSPNSRMGRGLIAAANGQPFTGKCTSRVSVALDGKAMASANASNRRAVSVFAQQGVCVHLTESPLHLKAAIVDGTVFLSDRNWARDRHSIIIAIPSEYRLTVERAILGEPRSQGPLSTRKGDALASEAALLRQRHSQNI
jgi:hypothetical protein